MKYVMLCFLFFFVVTALITADAYCSSIALYDESWLFKIKSNPFNFQIINVLFLVACAAFLFSAIMWMTEDLKRINKP